MSFLKKKKFNKTTIFQNLKTIYGIGANSANLICHNTGFNPVTTLSFLREDQLYKIFAYIEKEYFLIEANLKFYQKENIAYLLKVKNIRSIRNRLGLPVRGQRTHTNANTKIKLKRNKK